MFIRGLIPPYFSELAEAVPIGGYFCQGPKVIPQCQKSHRLQCIFTFTRKITTFPIDNVLLRFGVIYKFIEKLKDNILYMYTNFDPCVLKLQRFKHFAKIVSEHDQEIPQSQTADKP